MAIFTSEDYWRSFLKPRQKENMRRNRNKERRRLKIHSAFIPDVISPPSQWKTRQCIGDKIYWVYCHCLWTPSMLGGAARPQPRPSPHLHHKFELWLTHFFFFYFSAFNYSCASLWKFPRRQKITGCACVAAGACLSFGSAPVCSSWPGSEAV